MVLIPWISVTLAIGCPFLLAIFDAANLDSAAARKLQLRKTNFIVDKPTQIKAGATRRHPCNTTPLCDVWKTKLKLVISNSLFR
jgi:hypothetical protein